MNTLYFTLNGMTIIGVPAYHTRIYLDSAIAVETFKKYFKKKRGKIGLQNRKSPTAQYFRTL
jgi:hypothetical protein